jgi:hypothetical protein
MEIEHDYGSEHDIEQVPSTLQGVQQARESLEAPVRRFFVVSEAAGKREEERIVPASPAE